MQTIGLIAAMSKEGNALLRYVKPWKRSAIGPLRGYNFSISDQACVLVTSGMGIRRASEACRILVEVISPQILISFGIAGAVDADLDIGDVVLAKAFCRLEHGALSLIQPLADWPDAAREAAAQALASRAARLFAGTVVTTSGSQTFEYKLGEMKHPVLEMETAGIARVAAEKGIPLLSLRAISDSPRAPIPFDLGEVMDEEANLRVGNLLGLILRHPRIIGQSRQIRLNTRIAAENAAITLQAILSRAFPRHLEEKFNG